MNEITIHGVRVDALHPEYVLMDAALVVFLLWVALAVVGTVLGLAFESLAWLCAKPAVEDNQFKQCDRDGKALVVVRAAAALL